MYFSYILSDIHNCIFFSYLGFSAGTTVRLRKNSSLFFWMISSAVKPWLPFSTIFCPEDEFLP